MNKKMKKIKNDLDMDFIGGQGSLTKEEEKRLSEYFKSKKIINKSNRLIQTDKLTISTSM